VCDVQKKVLGVRIPQSIACEVWSLCFPGFCHKSLIISFLYVILFLLFTNDVTICMELDPGIHIGSTWFVLETGCDSLGPYCFFRSAHIAFRRALYTFLVAADRQDIIRQQNKTFPTSI
jgi:hypothetical protein